MKRMVLSQDVISAFITQQRQDEKSKATLEKYNRDILAFYSFLPEDKRVEDVYKRQMYPATLIFGGIFTSMWM